MKIKYFSISWKHKWISLVSLWKSDDKESLIAKTHFFLVVSFRSILEKKYIKHNSSLCLLWYLLTYHYLPSSSQRPRVFTQLNVTPRIQKWKITWRLCDISLTKPKNIHNSFSLRFDDDNWQMRWRYVLTTDDLFFFLKSQQNILNF